MSNAQIARKSGDQAVWPGAQLWIRAALDFNFLSCRFFSILLVFDSGRDREITQYGDAS